MSSRFHNTVKTAVASEKSRSSVFIVELNWVDLITLSGVLLSTTAIGFIFQGKYDYALCLLYLAVIADAFDGMLARKFNLQRDFGRYLDGFVDCIDYLIAPVIFFYAWGFSVWYQNIILMFFIMTGIIRLSVFNEVGNIQKEDGKLGYLGAPVFWSVLALGPLYFVSWFIEANIVFQAMNLIIPLYSLMMLHNGEYLKFKNPKNIFFGLLAQALLFLFHGLIKDKILLLDLVMLEINAALVLIFPLMLAGILHMVVVKLDIACDLKKPINEMLFGANKTWRGFIVMPITATLGFYFVFFFVDLKMNYVAMQLQNYSNVALGLTTGIAYIIGELPNSYIKRLLGIAPGEVPLHRSWLFIFFDQMDSLIACSAVYYFVFGVSGKAVALALVIAPLITYLTKKILYFLGLKKHAR